MAQIREQESGAHERVVAVPVVDLGGTHIRIGFIQRKFKGKNFVGHPELIWCCSQKLPVKTGAGEDGPDLNVAVDLVTAKIAEGIESLREESDSIEVVTEVGISSPGSWLANGKVYPGTVPNIPDLEDTELASIITDNLRGQLGPAWKAYVNNDGIANALTGAHFFIEAMKQGEFSKEKQILKETSKIIGFFPGTGFGAGGFVIDGDTITPMPGPQEFFDIVLRDGKGRFSSSELICEDLITGIGLGDIAFTYPVFRKAYPDTEFNGAIVAEATESLDPELKDAAVQIFEQVAIDLAQTMITLYEANGKKLVLNELSVEAEFWKNVKGCRIFIVGGWLLDPKVKKIVLPFVRSCLQDRGYANIVVVEADQIPRLGEAVKDAGAIGASFFTPSMRHSPEELIDSLFNIGNHVVVIEGDTPDMIFGGEEDDPMKAPRHTLDRKFIDAIDVAA